MAPELTGKAHTEQTVPAAELAGRLLCELDAAQDLLAHLHAAHPRTRAAFSQWWTTGEIENITAKGMSILDIQQRLGIDPLKALLLMDEVLQGHKEPQDLLRTTA